MKFLYELKDKFCEELEKISTKRDMSAGDLETAHKLTDTIKNIDKILMLEDGGYSEDGDWEAHGSYGSGNSYAGRRGKHYVRGHYSRNGHSQENRSKYSRDGYSRDGENAMEMLKDMMRNARGESEKDAIRRCIREIEEG